MLIEKLTLFLQLCFKNLFRKNVLLQEYDSHMLFQSPLLECFIVEMQGNSGVKFYFKACIEIAD